jgi:hypothetical protein
MAKIMNRLVQAEVVVSRPARRRLRLARTLEIRFEVVAPTEGDDWGQSLLGRAACDDANPAPCTAPGSPARTHPDQCCASAGGRDGRRHVDLDLKVVLGDVPC